MALVSAVWAQLILELVFKSLSDANHIIVLVVICSNIEHVNVVRVNLSWSWVVAGDVPVNFWVVSGMGLHSKGQES